MSENKLPHGNIGSADNKPPELGWRQGVLGVGVFLLVVSLFISAGAKGALGRVPLVVAWLGVVLLVIPMIAGIIDYFSAKGKTA